MAAFPVHAVAQPEQWDPTLPRRASAGAPGDPVAIANASLEAARIATETTLELGRSFLMGAALPTVGAPRSVRAKGPMAIEYVVRRAGSQLGVPYSWGGGDVNGPSAGVDSGAGTVGFDCSGLTRFAFAGVGILLPRWSGDQYTAGRQVPRAQARRGDLLFWGPGGSQHEALYLGNGQMVEAQQSGVPVKVSPVRLGGMTPNVTRVIDV
ncbi:NlpC/P60 family protein [Mycolicibacterium gilvum]|nr:NlpC/P60 family protein [Mycolicibacterium gilvum]MCV7056598.1 C40 family peptidase [Mycolicibacterium gilvum]